MRHWPVKVSRFSRSVYLLRIRWMVDETPETGHSLSALLGRCVFIHDARATGPAKVTLRPPPNLGKTSGSSSRTQSSKLLGGEGIDGGNSLSFPDIPRDPDSAEVYLKCMSVRNGWCT